MAEVKRYLTPVFRLSFPSLFEKSAMDEKSKAKYGLTAVWTPAKFSEADKKRWRTILGALDAESKLRFKKAWKDLPANFKPGIRDGAEKADLLGFGEGTKFASVTSMMRPGVVDKDRDPISSEEPHSNADEIYPGCYCRATVTVYSYDNKGKGVALGLMNVQKIADGERLDSRTDAADDFEEGIDDECMDSEASDGEVDPLG